jgi:hypothetical protein
MTKSPKVSSRKARSPKPRQTPKRTRKNKTASKVVAEKVRGSYRATAQNVSAEGGRDTWNTTLLETQHPNTFRVLAERNLAHTRELYEGSKNTLQAVLESWQKSFGAAGQGAAALNRRFIDLAERNVNTGFDLAMGLAGARNLAEVMELQATYWHKLLGDLQSERRAQSTARIGSAKVDV